MEHNIKLTVGLLTYNRGSSGYLREALDAILAQTYKDFELLVMDNHSTDETSEIVLGYKDPRLIYVRQPPDGNGTTNYISALWMSRGKHILITHDDDIMEPDMLEKQMAFIAEHPDLLCVSTNVSLMDHFGNSIQSRLYEIDYDMIFRDAKYIPTYLEEKLWMPTPTLLFNRAAHIAAIPKMVRKQKAKYISSGDIWLLFLLSLKGPIGMLAEPLLRYRQHPGQESRNVDQSAPLMGVAQSLLTSRGRNPRLRPHLPAIHAASARYKTQNMLFRNAKKSNQSKVIKNLVKIKEKWEKSMSPEQRAIDMILPFEIFLCILDLGETVPRSAFQKLRESPAKSGAQKGYRDWLHAIHQETNLFAGKPQFQKIAILGSMLTAFLLVQEARRNGIEVVACLDTSPARIGENVLGVPVVPHEALKEMSSLDAVILSNERDHEHAVKKMLAFNMPDPKLPVLSWKEMAAKAPDIRKKECTIFYPPLTGMGETINDLNHPEARSIAMTGWVST